MLLRLLLWPYKQKASEVLTDYPKVCIQLPVYNEAAVAERLIRSVVKIEYPQDKLQIQILDDSSDETSEIIQNVLRDLNNPRYVEHIRRKDRIGYKAGALSYGLTKTDAELVAIFDADFVPDSDFLLKTIPYFENPKIAFVQARWGYLNRFKNLLTRAQAILIDGHFMIEHACRSMFACFNFNGTAGVWRKQAIEDAGGWSGDTITEDLDLSYRAFLKGWKAEYLRDVVCKSELPEDLDAFKSQQFRWMKGSAQVFRKLIIKIFQSKLSVLAKVEAFFHLSANVCYQLMLLTAILIVPVTVVRTAIGFSLGLWFEFVLFLITISSVYSFYYAAQRFQTAQVSHKEILLGMILGIGIAAHCAFASLAGFIMSFGEFVRTPKSGGLDEDHHETECLPISLAIKNTFRQRKEIFMFLYLSCGICYLLYKSYFLTIPFVTMITFGYALVLYSAFCPSSHDR